MSGEKSAKAYDRLGARYDTLTKVADKTMFDKMKRWLIEPNASGRVLEVGVGTGKNFKFYPKDCDLVGVDISAKSLAEARKKADASGTSCDLVVGDVTKGLPFDSGSFDAVVMTLVSCNLENPVLAYEEMRRVTKKGGKALFLEHAPTPGLWATMLLTFPISYPIARFALNCKPFSNNIKFIPYTFQEIARKNLGDGMLQAIVTEVP